MVNDKLPRYLMGIFIILLLIVSVAIPTLSYIAVSVSNCMYISSKEEIDAHMQYKSKLGSEKIPHGSSIEMYLYDDTELKK